MARRSTSAPRSTAKAEQAQSNTVLIVFVVISMLANVGLGIMWYLSQDEITSAKSAKDKADTEARNAQAKKKEVEDYYLVALRQMIDNGSVSAEELNALTAAKTKAEQDPLPWWPGLSRKIAGDGNANDPLLKAGIVGPVDPATNKLANSLAGRIKALDEQVVQLRRNLKGRDDELAKVNAEFAEYKKTWNETVLATKLKDAGTRADADTREKLNQKDIVNKDLLAKISSLEKQVAQMLENEKATASADRKKLEERFEQALSNKDKEIQEITKRLDDRQKVALDKPRGKIVRATSTGDQVYINLGSAAGMQPGVTFSVHGVGPAGTPMADPKARIEVISVLSKDLSLARVKQLAKPELARRGLTSSDEGYWVSDPKEFWRAQNPILPGDLLYNPAWEPNETVHVALAGYYDVDGDGQDDLPAFIRMLKSQGVEVDAYLDPADGFKQKGRMTSGANGTKYLIIGGATTTANESLNTIQAEAAKRGIEVISLPRFLDKMGLGRERLPVTKSGMPTAPAGEAKPADAPAGDKPAGDGEMKEGNGK